MAVENRLAVINLFDLSRGPAAGLARRWKKAYNSRDDT
jgi:hypothetical protein